VNAPRRRVRRVLLPLVVVIEIGLGTCLIAICVLAALVAPLTPRRRVLRLTSFGALYVAVDLAAVAACAGLSIRRAVQPGFEATWEDAHYRLLRWALGVALGGAKRAFEFRVDFEEPSDAAALYTDDPVLVLARHAGPGDSFVIVHKLLADYKRRPKIVLKRTLAFDPALDLLLSRLSCCFLPSRSGSGEDLAEELRGLSERLGPRDALLIFPEGGNWTPKRRGRAIAKLRRRGKQRAVATAMQTPDLMPPRPGGVLACLDSRPDAKVVVFAHTGLEELISVSSVWRSLPLRRSMRLSWWSTPRHDVPLGDERVAWLQDEWVRLEAWISGHLSPEPLMW